MNAKLALAVLCLAFASGCASEPKWDMTQFPPQPTYDTGSTGQATASK